MPTLIQINVSRNWGSTGKIAEGIALSAREKGWKCYIVHGQRYQLPSEFPSIQVSSRTEELVHYAKSLFLDMQGQGSTLATKKLIKQIHEIKPDIIHLHVIHGCYINFPILFDYIKKESIFVVWTFHDCWAFTGHCVYFDRIGCEKWRSQCFDCPQKREFPKALYDGSKRNYLLKKSIFSGHDYLTIVSVSNWLGELVSKSFLKQCPIRVIHNGIDLNLYKTSDADLRSKYNIAPDKHIILGVANGYGKRKGIYDFVKLAETLPSDYQVVMVGVLPKDQKVLTDSIVSIGRTDSQQELIDLYSSAAVFINPTYEDNFPTTNLESLACGTPVITYQTGGSPEAINEETGIVVQQGDVEAFRNAIIKIVSDGKEAYSEACRTRALNCFNRKDRFNEYINLYNQILEKR